MKRLFPRAVPEALIALLFVGGACSPTSNVKPGAPVLTQLSVIDPSGSHLADVTADTVNCAMGSAEGQDCDPATAVCELGANVVCTCVAKDMCDPSIKADAAVTGGTLNCTFPPLSTVLATFDRLLDTAPFVAGTPVATLTANPQTGAMTATDYTSSGSQTGFIFSQFFGNPAGPHISVSGDPALPTDSTVTVALISNLVRAKDGKTDFTGSNLLADGTIAFKTSSFTVSGVTVPAPPPPMSTDMGGSMMPMGCPDAGTMMPVDMDAGADAQASGNTDGGVDGDAAASEAGASAADGGVDATVDSTSPTADSGATDGGVDATADGATAPTADSGAAETGGTGSDAAASEAGATPPSTDVPADMNMGPVVIAFTNNVKADVLTHIKLTEDGQPFADFMPAMDQAFPSATVTIVPKTMWAAGKTYVVTIDADATDALGKKLGAPATATFTMSAN